MKVGNQVEITIRNLPEVPARRGEVTKVKRDGDFYVTDHRSFGHWFGGPAEHDQLSPDGGSVFFVKILEEKSR